MEITIEKNSKEQNIIDWTNLYVKKKSYLINILQKKYTLKYEDALEHVHEAFTRVLENINNFDSTRIPMSYYILTIASRIVAQRFKNEQHKYFYVIDEYYEIKDLEIKDLHKSVSDLQFLINRWIDENCNHVQKQIMYYKLFHIDDMGIKEIIKNLEYQGHEISYQTVSKTYNNLKNRIINYLKENGKFNYDLYI
jgi:nucleoid DNA-binding protein